MGHARTLVNVENPKIQIEAYYKIMDEELSVRKAEDIVRKINKGQLKGTINKEIKEKLMEDYKDLQEQLSGFFTSKVQFRVNEQGKGKIVIPFESGEDLERIMSILDKFKD